MKYFKHITLLCLLFVSIFVLASCKGTNGEPDPVDIQVTQVLIQGTKNISVNQQTTFTATIHPDNATNIKLTWSVTLKTGEATIDDQGVLTATKAGSVTVKATASNGIYGEMNVAILNAPVSVTHVEIIGDDTFTHGDRKNYTIVVTPENATYEKVEWSIASGLGKVDPNGSVAARAAGVLMINVKVDGMSATKALTVLPYQGSVSAVKVLLNRVDLKNTVLKDYKNEFEALYPMHRVVFETLLDYETNARMRLSGGDYGDVMLIPSAVAAKNLSYYYAPLGNLEEVSSSWRYVSQKAYEGVVYGLPTYGNVNGILYNKKVFTIYEPQEELDYTFNF